MSRLTRRTFLSSTAAGVAAATALRPSAASARIQGANDRVRVAVIGTGRQGVSDMRNHMALADVEIAAVCDVYGANLAKAAALAPKAAQVKDFRAVLDDKDIDAVIIGTPDHWHALMTVMACQAGKDVYVEKPTSVAIVEGRKMVEAARKYNRIVQVGTQQRSAKHFQQAAKLVQDGGIGKVAAVRCWNVGNQSPDGIGNPPDGDPPADLDWDLWLGPAPKPAVQRQPLRRRAHQLLVLPLVLGLRRRHDDRLGRAPDRHRADGDEGGRADGCLGGRRQVLSRRQPRDAGHDPGQLPVSRAS